MKLLDEFPFNCDIYRKQINESLKPTEREEEETYCNAKFEQRRDFEIKC